MNFKLKLKYHIPAPTALDPCEIIDRAELELKDKKYNIKSATYTSISFYDNPWRLRWNTEPLMLDGGEFVITNDPIKGRTLTLNYYYNFLWPVLLITGLTISMTVEHEYPGLLYLGTFWAVAITIDNMRARGKAKALITAVLGPDT